MHSDGRQWMTARTMSARRAWMYCCSIIAVIAPAASSTPAVALTAAGIGKWPAMQERALAGHEVVRRVADKPAEDKTKKDEILKWNVIEAKVPACNSSADWSDPKIWKEVKACIEARQRDPFSDPATTQSHLLSQKIVKNLTKQALEIMDAVAKASERQRGKVSDSVPLSAPITLDERYQDSKEHALRNFENQERLDVERDLRDLLGTR